jgi:hypothetical protein
MTPPNATSPKLASNEREALALADELDRAASALAELARAARATCEARRSCIKIREALVSILRGRS